MRSLCVARRIGYLSIMSVAFFAAGGLDTGNTRADLIAYYPLDDNADDVSKRNRPLNRRYTHGGVGRLRRGILHEGNAGQKRA